MEVLLFLVGVVKIVAFKVTETEKQETIISPVKVLVV